MLGRIRIPYSKRVDVYIHGCGDLQKSCGQLYKTLRTLTVNHKDTCHYDFNLYKKGKDIDIFHKHIRVFA